VILLTGSSGFIGTALLGKLELPVRCVVRSGSRVTADCSSVFRIDNLSSTTCWDGAFHGVDTIVHLAAVAHKQPTKSTEYDSHLWETNVAGPVHLARSAADRGVRRFVFLSSAAVHGSSGEQPFSETDTPAPSGPYGASKWNAELGLREVSRETGIECVLIRAPMVYGPNAPGTFSRLLRAALSGVPLPIKGVRNSRSFIGINNLVDIIIRCTVHPKAANETFLVSDGMDLSTEDFFRLLCNSFGRPCRMFKFPMPILIGAASAIRRRADAISLVGSHQVNIRKAKHMLGWTPPMSVKEQIEQIARTINLKAGF
jgi:nucleoside-diphosphate-sugar epimerase